ncbi:MAG: MMPL family transporter [Desulfobacterales bacterium]|nr:MMPL family transporter [Desulfobacterales bacterium]MCP4163219.1 MMPL family transporter [Deltaproteobacteria bacterium]
MKNLMLWSKNHPIVVVLIISLLTTLSIFGVKKLRVDASASGMMIKGDPAIKYYENTLARFGSDNVTIIYVKDKNLFTPEKLKKLDELFYELQEIKSYKGKLKGKDFKVDELNVDDLEDENTDLFEDVEEKKDENTDLFEVIEKAESLFSVTNFKGEMGVLSTDQLMDYPPETLEEAQQVKKDALRNPVLVNNIISSDGNVTAINLYVKPDPKDPDFVINFTDKIDEILKKFAPHFDEVFQLGNSYTKRSITNSILNDQSTMVPLSVIVLLTILVISMRSASGAILPILTAGSSVIWTGGFMGYFGIPLNILTVIVPSLIIVIGSTEDMHLLAEYVEGLHENKGLKDRAIAYMVSKTGTAVMLTALTTFLGFLSITINEILILKQFGIVAAFGLFINPIITCMISPVYLKYFGPRIKEKAKAGIIEKFMNAVAERIIRIIHASKWLVFGVLMGGAIVICTFTLRVKVDNDLLGYFKPDSIIRVRSQILHEEIAGSQVIFIRITSGVEGLFKKPESLKQIVKIQDFIKKEKAYDKTSSLADYIKMIHREMNDGKDEFHKIPNQPDKIAQYLLTLQRDEISRFVTADFSEVNIMVRHNIGSSYELKDTVNRLKKFIKENINPHFIVGYTGENILVNTAADSMASGQVASLSLLLVIIFIIMSILFVNVKAGFLSLIPNFFPIILVFGIMGIFDIPLNVGTAMVAAIAIGIAVDDTIHFMTRYNKEMQILQDQNKAMEVCIRSEIQPVMSTSIALSMGFAVVCFSSFVPIVYFGFLSACVMAFALLGDLFITPILLSSTQLITLWDMIGLRLRDEVIEQSNIFKNLKPRQIKRVILLGRVLEKKKGDYAIKYGDEGNSMFLILDGEAEVIVSDASGSKKTVATFKPGNIFGEIAMVNPGPRTADIKASKDLQYLEIDWKGMNRIKMIYPRIAVNLYHNLSIILGERLKATNKQLMEASK